MTSNRSISPKNLAAIAGFISVLAGIAFIGAQIEWPAAFAGVVKDFETLGIKIHTNWPGFALAAIGAVLLLASLDWRKNSK